MSYESTIGEVPDHDAGVVVFLACSCLSNGTQISRAAYGIHSPFDERLDYQYRLSGQLTKRRAEILGVLGAIEQARLYGYCNIIVKVDSNYPRLDRLLNDYRAIISDSDLRAFKDAVDRMRSFDFEGCAMGNS